MHYDPLRFYLICSDLSELVLIFVEICDDADTSHNDNSNDNSNGNNKQIKYTWVCKSSCWYHHRSERVAPIPIKHDPEGQFANSLYERNTSLRYMANVASCEADNTNLPPDGIQLNASKLESMLAKYC